MLARTIRALLRAVDLPLTLPNFPKALKWESYCPLMSDNLIRGRVRVEKNINY